MCVFWFSQPNAHCAHDVRCALNEMPVVWIYRNGANFDQHLIVGRRRLFNVLKFEVRHAIVAIDNGFYRIAWCCGFAAVVSRSPVRDEDKQECDYQQEKNHAHNPLQYSFHKSDDFCYSVTAGLMAPLWRYSGA